jgi:prepilin-type N-terminal cleavage/methylation domain-containing protein
MKNSRGFTLIEVTVTVAIIAILSAGILFGITEAQQKSRDAKRVADLRTLQTAIELYKQKYGQYPEGCKGAGVWSGQAGTNHACATGNQYIIGHIDTTDWDNDGNRTERFSFAPDFIPALPRDPKLNGNDSGYVYVTNSDGTVYKLMALNTVESETLTPQSLFSRCGNTDDGMAECSMVPGSATDGLDSQYNQTGSTPNQCFSEMSNDYAVTGGFADGPGAKAQEYYSDIIRCK